MPSKNSRFMWKLRILSLNHKSIRLYVHVPLKCTIGFSFNSVIYLLIYFYLGSHLKKFTFLEDINHFIFPEDTEAG